MNAGQMIKLLQTIDPMTQIGTCIADVTGYVSKVTGIFTTEFEGKQILAIDGSDESFGSDELDLKKMDVEWESEK